MSPCPLRAITYSRVSTAHHEQKPEAQVEELRRYCSSRGWQNTQEVIDHGYSGGTDQRPGLKQLMTLARARKVDVVVVSKLDRLFRSLKHLVAVLDELEGLGVKFVSTHDQIDLTTAAGRLMLHIVAAFSEFERSLIRERTLMGLDHARRKGKRLGRPRTRNDGAILALRGAGLSYGAIAARLGVSDGAVYRALKPTLKRSSEAPAKSLFFQPPMAADSAASITNVLEAT